MSEVISFRLDKDNPCESRALDILVTWCNEGFSVRYVITEALFELDRNRQETESIELNELKDTISQVNHLLRQIEIGNSLPGTKHLGYKTRDGLSASFVALVKKSAKSGLKLD